MMRSVMCDSSVELETSGKFKNLVWWGDQNSDPANCGTAHGMKGFDIGFELRICGNHVYFYNSVNTKNILVLNSELKNLANSILSESIIKEIPPAPIHLHIQSGGGSLHSGFSAMDNIIDIKNRGVPVYTHIEGAAASAATLMSVVGTKRFMTPHSFILIHELSSFVFGKFSRMIDDWKNCEAFMKMMKEIYKEYTKISEEELEEILKHDIYWDATSALSKGLIDEIK